MADDIALFLARLLVASVFALSAYDKFRALPAEVAAIGALHLPAPKFLERFTGVCEVIGCLMLITGLGARLAALLLGLFTLMVTVLFLRFWSFKGTEDARLAQRNTFFSNLAMIGALIYIYILGPGQIGFGPAL